MRTKGRVTRLFFLPSPAKERVKDSGFWSCVVLSARRLRWDVKKQGAGFPVGIMGAVLSDTVVDEAVAADQAAVAACILNRWATIRLFARACHRAMAWALAMPLTVSRSKPRFL